VIWRWRTDANGCSIFAKMSAAVSDDMRRENGPGGRTALRDFSDSRAETSTEQLFCKPAHECSHDHIVTWTTLVDVALWIFSSYIGLSQIYLRHVTLLDPIGTLVSTFTFGSF